LDLGLVQISAIRSVRVEEESFDSKFRFRFARFGILNFDLVLVETLLWQVARYDGELSVCLASIFPAIENTS
jgi:hypothetical protein